MLERDGGMGPEALSFKNGDVGKKLALGEGLSVAPVIRSLA